MDKDVSAACQMFLIPSTIMFTALANAGTEGLKVGIGTVGLITALIWFFRIRGWATMSMADRKAANGLSVLFVFAWAIVTLVHLYFGWKYGLMRS